MTLAHFTALVPVEPGREEALRKTLAHLGAEHASPFADVPGTHMARLYVLDHYGGTLRGPVAHRALEPALLVLTAVVDDPVTAWLDDLERKIASTAEVIWSHCTGFPGMAGNDFARWLHGHDVRPSFDVIAHKEGTLTAVREGLDLRERLGEFAARMQGAPPAVVRAAYRGWFGR